MILVALLVLTAVAVLGYGFVRSNTVALVVGAVLLADAMLFYIVFGPAAAFVRSIVGG